MCEIIRKYFPDIDEATFSKFEKLGDVYREWNAKINVISRKDIDNLYEHHILHSLAIAKTFSFPDNAKVLDVGTGGGFPGIPLAIMFPNVEFTLIDSIGKKLTVADAAAKAAGLANVKLVHENAMDERGLYNYVVSRAVMNAASLLKMTLKNLTRPMIGDTPNGLIVLKGGDLSEELMDLERMKSLNKRLRKGFIRTLKINDLFKEDYYDEKYVVQMFF